MSERAGKRKGVRVIETRAPLVQVMPGGRARIDPSCVMPLVWFIRAIRAQYDRESVSTVSGMSGRAREAKRGMIVYARFVCECLDKIERALHGTVSLDDYYDARDQFERALAALSAGD
jgi:hypothetical protein